MAQAESSEPNAEKPAVPPILIKKYANRRLYNTETSSYITLDNLADMVRQGRDFYVQDARSGEDLTRAVLTQIIVDEESKVGRAMLPIPFLRQLIGFYGDSLQGVVPGYLEEAMAMFSRQQQELRATVQQTMGSFIPPGFEEVGRRNMAMLDRAMNLFSPFYRNPAAHHASEAPTSDEPDMVASMRAEIDQLRDELAVARKAAQPAHNGTAATQQPDAKQPARKSK